MKVPGIIVLVAISALATACSSGSSGIPVVTAPPAGQNSTGGGSTGVPPGMPALIPALPGLVGYDLVESSASAAIALADEDDDVPWAEQTESLILDEISDLIIAPNELIAIECRTTWCGMVVDGPDTVADNLHREIADRLRERFAVTGVSTFGMGRPQGDWIAVFIRIVRMV